MVGRIERPGRTIRKGRKFRLAVVTLLASVVGTYLLLGLAAFLGQRSMLYPTPPLAKIFPILGGRLITLEGEASRKIHAFYVPHHPKNLQLEKGE